MNNRLKLDNPRNLTPERYDKTQQIIPRDQFNTVDPESDMNTSRFGKNENLFK